MTPPAEDRSGDPDVALMLRVRAGDERAFEDLVRRHTRSVLTIIARYLRDPSRAEDAAQDVFVKVYKARASYEPQAKFSTWLFRIAVNHCLNELRARRNQPAAPAPEDELLAAPASERPGDRMSLDDLQAAVREALDSLPENQRIAVILARYEELPYGQIAEAMNLSLEAVKSLLFRARENLRQRLAGYVR